MSSKRSSRSLKRHISSNSLVFGWKEEQDFSSERDCHKMLTHIQKWTEQGKIK
jgi:hypothetical protein